MEIKLSAEMIEKICCVAFGRIHDLEEKEKIVKESMAVGKVNINKKHIQLKDIQKSKEDAEDIYSLFLEVLNEIKK